MTELDGILGECTVSKQAIARLASVSGEIVAAIFARKVFVRVDGFRTSFIALMKCSVTCGSLDNTFGKCGFFHVTGSMHVHFNRRSFKAIIRKCFI